MKVNDFNIDLQWSLEQGECEMFDKFYHRVFPKIKTIELAEDMKLQRRGIDKTIHFESGYKITIDEKKRRKSYSDIALETWSKHEDRKRGWLYYAQCDYIVYAIMPDKTIYLLPVLLLKRAWHKNGDDWIKKYKERSARNPGYTTKFVPVPANVLLNQIYGEMTQEFKELA